MESDAGVAWDLFLKAVAVPAHEVTKNVTLGAVARWLAGL
jgi:hypothetical protein